jgi:hypothetical protein
MLQSDFEEQKHEFNPTKLNILKSCQDRNMEHYNFFMCNNSSVIAIFTTFNTEW